MTEAGAATLLEQALEAESADSRRSAVQRLAAGRYARHDIVVNGCATIARTDSSSSVRCAALELVVAAQRLAPTLREPDLPGFGAFGRSLATNVSARVDAVGLAVEQSRWKQAITQGGAVEKDLMLAAALAPVAHELRAPAAKLQLLLTKAWAQVPHSVVPRAERERGRGGSSPVGTEERLFDLVRRRLGHRHPMGGKIQSAREIFL